MRAKKLKRPLTDIEQQFVKDAEAGMFGVAFDDNGAPFAHGAEDTDNLFSMEVDSLPEPSDPETWCYFLPDNHNLRNRLRR